MDPGRTILHCDMNNFFASVECLEHPELRTRPVAVCGDPEKRHGIILAKNDPAKRYGIQTGETIAAAQSKCPFLTLLPSHYEKYAAYSRYARSLYESYTDRVESFGLDECWLDVTGSKSLFGSGKKIADEIRHRIRKETGLTVSAGVSHSKIFAKLGSDYKKPDATTVIDRDNYREIVWPLPVGSLLYVGPASAMRLQMFGIRTIGELANADSAFLTARFGKNGIKMQLSAQGLDGGTVEKADRIDPPKSISNGITPPRDMENETDAAVVLSVLCDSVASRLRAWGQNCSRVTVNFRTPDLRSFQRSTLLPAATCVDRDLLRAALQLYRYAFPKSAPLRSISIAADRLSPIESRQLSFLDNSQQQAKRELLSETVDRVRAKHGNSILRPCLSLLDPALAGFYPKEDPRFRVFGSREPVGEPSPENPTCNFPSGVL